MENPASGLWEHTACRIRKTVRRKCRSPEDSCPDVPLTLQGDSFAAYGLHRPGFSPAGTAEGEGISVSFWECVDDEAVLSVKSAASPSVSFQRVCKPMPSATVRIIQEPVRKTNGPRGSILPPGPAVWIRLLYILASCASICMLSGVSPSRRARAYTSSRPLVSK